LRNPALSPALLVAISILAGACAKDAEVAGEQAPSEQTEAAAEVPPRSKPVCPEGMLGISGGTFELGESDPDLLARYAPDRILPASRHSIVPYCVGLYPFPGRAGLPWPVDGLGPDDLPGLEALLHRHGRRLCTALELTLAAAGPENRRYPWHATDRHDRVCETDDLRPASLGSRPNCRSSFGLWDLQVRSSWILMDPGTRSVLERPADNTSPGHDSVYWLWGGNARDNTYYAPSNFGLHHHLPGTPPHEDDALRVCADPGATSAAQESAWNALVERYPETVSFGLLQGTAR